MAEQWMNGCEPSGRGGEPAGTVLRNRHLPATLLLMGSFAFGYNTATFLHELGHAVAAWATDVSVKAIHIHPFAWSSTLYETAPSHPLLVCSAGVGFATLAGVFLLVAGWTWWSPWSELLSLTAICAIVDSGVYLAVDSLLEAGGDGTDMVAMGVPLGLLVGVGVALTIIGAAIGMLRLQRIGLMATDGVAPRLLVLVGGIGPYLLAMLGWHLASNREEIVLWLAYVTIGLILLTGMAVGSRVLQMRILRLRIRQAVQPTWAAAISSLLVGVGVVLWGLLA